MRNPPRARPRRPQDEGLRVILTALLLVLDSLIWRPDLAARSGGRSDLDRPRWHGRRWASHDNMIHPVPARLSGRRYPARPWGLHRCGDPGPARWLGGDLQLAVNRDRKADVAAYPALWAARHPDRLSVTGTPLILHTIGAGAQDEDILFAYPMTGHFRIGHDGADRLSNNALLGKRVIYPGARRLKNSSGISGTAFGGYLDERFVALQSADGPVSVALHAPVTPHLCRAPPVPPPRADRQGPPDGGQSGALGVHLWPYPPARHARRHHAPVARPVRSHRCSPCRARHHRVAPETRRGQDAVTRGQHYHQGRSPGEPPRQSGRAATAIPPQAKARSPAPTARSARPASRHSGQAAQD